MCMYGILLSLRIHVFNIIIYTKLAEKIFAISLLISEYFLSYILSKFKECISYLNIIFFPGFREKCFAKSYIDVKRF
jgi:hypothetical protein